MLQILLCYSKVSDKFFLLSCIFIIVISSTMFSIRYIYCTFIHLYSIHQLGSVVFTFIPLGVAVYFNHK